ncbi:MAG TPA: DUF1566 domain-containing protein [Xanthomonadaceae bacterium]
MTLADQLVELQARDMTITLRGLKDQDDERIGDIEILARYVQAPEAAKENASEAAKPKATAQLEWSHTLGGGERMSYAAAEEAVAALGEGWRLPSIQELLSIVDYTRSEPAIDIERFPDTKSGAYWTSTTCAWAPRAAWIVSFHGGDANGYRRDDGDAVVRAVRSLPAGQ